MSAYKVQENGLVRWVLASGREVDSEVSIPHEDDIRDAAGVAALLRDIADRMESGTLERGTEITYGT